MGGKIEKDIYIEREGDIYIHIERERHRERERERERAQVDSLNTEGNKENFALQKNRQTWSNTEYICY